MRFNEKEVPERLMWIICMIKIYHDAGFHQVEKYLADTELDLDMDCFYEFVVEGLESAAPIVRVTKGLYEKYGYDEDDCEVNIMAYSSDEMQKCFKLIRKIDRLEKSSKPMITHEREFINKIERSRGFMSYCFDWNIGNKRKSPQLEVLWDWEFTEEIPMCIWIVRTMQLCKEELPKLQEMYRQARRKKRFMKSKVSGGVICAA